MSARSPPLDLVQAQAEVADRRENLIRANATAGDAEDRLRRPIMDVADSSFWGIRLDPVDDPPARGRCLTSTGPSPPRSRTATTSRGRRTTCRTPRRRSSSSTTSGCPTSARDVVPRATDWPAPSSFARARSPARSPARATRASPTRSARCSRGDFPTWSVGVTVNYPLGTATKR